MKNKKGFTLIEILCVILILALITFMASTSVLKLRENGNKEVYCAKINMILKLAKEYAVKYERELNESTELFKGYPSLKIKVKDLVLAGKLEYDDEENVLNPLDNSSLNETEIIIYLKNKKINAYIDNNNIC